MEPWNAACKVPEAVGSLIAFFYFFIAQTFYWTGGRGRSSHITWDIKERAGLVNLASYNGSVVPNKGQEEINCIWVKVLRILILQNECLPVKGCKKEKFKDTHPHKRKERSFCKASFHLHLHRPVFEPNKLLQKWD